MYAAISYACEERRDSDKLLSAVELYLLTSTLWPHHESLKAAYTRRFTCLLGQTYLSFYLLTSTKLLEACEERLDSYKLLLVLELVDVLGLLALLVQQYKY